MANAILDAVWSNQPFYRLGIRQVAMLAFLADKADAYYRESWYTQREMASVFQCSIKTVYTTLCQLRTGGYIEIVDCNGEACVGHPHRKTPHYRVAKLHGERKPSSSSPAKTTTTTKRAPDPAPKRGRGRPRKQVVGYEPQTYPSQTKSQQRVYT